MEDGTGANRSKVAVTGAGGFIGRSLCTKLAARGADVIAIDLDPQAAGALTAAGAEFRPADTSDRRQIGEALAGAVEVVHAAAIVSDSGSMREHVRVNVEGTANVLDAAAESGVSKVLHISSVAVYGYEAAGPTAEESIPRSCGVPYIDTKSASDRLARRRGAIVVRPGDVYGPGSVPWAIRPVELARRRLLSVPSDGPSRMLPVYIDDLVEALMLAIDRGEPGRAYTVYDDREEVTFADLFDRYSQLVGRGAVPRLPPALIDLFGLAEESVARVRGTTPKVSRNSRTLISRRAAADAGPARRDLGWEPRVSFDEGMRETAAWLRRTGRI